MNHQEVIMTIPWSALFGGMLLGISATILMLFKGKVAGISGIVSGAITPSSVDKGWRIQFIIGLIAGGFLTNWLVQPELSGIPAHYSSSIVTMLLAGLLVGLGTKLGNGCTSGHGICGMGRFSIRSMIATLTFMLVAAVTVYIRLHVL
ncbi:MULTISPECIES: YeeE/YedE thiosulfate transporter family protein [Vibrio]|uniref:YeeE/YedE family protein n=2 Tax=Vibrio TaxID=662 RepID=UPI002453B002|nr:YeeE/YedE thiosulfate transporter family protein [Vibrio litoralis]